MAKPRRHPPRPDLPAGFFHWTAEQYDIASEYGGIEQRAGFTYKGIGIHLQSSFKARYRRKDGSRKVYEYWALTHLNTGHGIRLLVETPLTTALDQATALADSIDWSFDGLDGWRNREPDLPTKLQAWATIHQVRARGGGGQREEAIARTIGMRRW